MQIHEPNICNKDYCILHYHLYRQQRNYNQVLIPKKDKEIFMFQMNTWTGIYRNSFIRENHIRHNETPGASYQDNGFFFQTMVHSKCAMIVNYPYYRNRQNNWASP